ncbi:hypothetical protein DENSPDRAFT_927220 [Dentipellis sp. KUC8613]|nr:hypothetical protein DENSPDRAFT_927220 [Dentipellis sp. KUC8613]
MSDPKSHLAHPLKRRLTSPADLGFFTPSATSFQPRPYNPSGSSAGAPKPPPPARNNALAHPLPPMDPSPTDPHCVFIHPPFTAFPESHLHPEGLTYALMAANPDWFLDPLDFISTKSTNPDAISYPSQLEPPRGWCPAKKKDLKERGVDSWPDGEEPRLRCTFCRRTYAGVNAKSMWRRHVFEKHKIAMANRRDNLERSRKGANGGKEVHEKENVQVTSRHGRVSTASLSSGSQGAGGQASSSKSKLRALRPAAGSKASALFDRGNGNESYDDDEDVPVPSAPRIPQDEFPMLEPAPKLSRPPLSKSSSRISPTPPPDSPQSDTVELQAPVSDEAPPTPVRPLIPASPYNPLVTPSFRHSPPRLPSDQPWRFPSPSHPLHSSAREMCLSMIVRGQASPSDAPVAGSIGIDVSPVIIAPRSGKASVFSTPGTVTFGKSKDAVLETPLFGEKGLGLIDATKATPRRLFISGSTPVSVTDRLSLKQFRSSDEAPQRPGGVSITPRTIRTPSKLMSSWLSDASTPARHRRSLLASLEEDPFSNIYGTWPDLQKQEPGGQIATPPTTSPESESPVVRTSKFQNGSVQRTKNGLMTTRPSLLEPFSLKRESEDEDNGEIEEMLMSSPVSRARTVGSKGGWSNDRASDDGHEDLSDIRPPLRKRRRTIAG